MIDNDPSITRLAEFRCPECGHKCSAVGTTDGTAGSPSAGNVCGCIACGCPMVFVLSPLDGVTLQLRKMTVAEIDQLSNEEKRELGRVQSFAHLIYQPSRARMN